MTSAYAASPIWIWRNRHWLAQQDIIHCHLSFGSAFGCLVQMIVPVTGGNRPAIVETYHAVGMAIPRFHRWIHSWLAARRDALVLMARDPYWDRFVAARPTLMYRVIENGIDVDLQTVGSDDERLAYRRSLGIPDSCRWVVGTVGQLRDDRRPWEFIALFSRIADTLGPNVQFLMAGEGESRKRVEREIAAHKMAGRVHMAGLVASAARPAALMDVYLTVAVGSVVGLAALEAAFVGTPIIALQFDRDHQRRPSDWIWSDSDGAAVADEVARLLKSETKRISLSQAQKQIANARFGISAMGMAYQDLYRDVLKMPKTSTAKHSS